MVDNDTSQTGEIGQGWMHSLYSALTEQHQKD